MTFSMLSSLLQLRKGIWGSVLPGAPHIQSPCFLVTPGNTPRNQQLSRSRSSQDWIPTLIYAVQNLELMTKPSCFSRLCNSFGKVLIFAFSHAISSEIKIHCCCYFQRGAGSWVEVSFLQEVFSVDSAEESSVTITLFCQCSFLHGIYFYRQDPSDFIFFLIPFSFSEVASVDCPYTDIFIHPR